MNQLVKLVESYWWSFIAHYESTMNFLAVITWAIPAGMMFALFMSIICESAEYGDDVIDDFKKFVSVIKDFINNHRRFVTIYVMWSVLLFVAPSYEQLVYADLAPAKSDITEQK